MGEKTCFGKHEFGHCSKIIERRLVPQFCQTVSRSLVSGLGFVTQREQNLFTACFRPFSCNIEYLLRRQIGGF